MVEFVCESCAKQRQGQGHGQGQVQCQYSAEVSCHTEVRVRHKAPQQGQRLLRQTHALPPQAPPCRDDPATWSPFWQLVSCLVGSNLPRF